MLFTPDRNIPPVQPLEGAGRIGRAARIWRRRPFVSLIVAGAGALVVALFAGFVVFAVRLPRAEPALTQSADGIVALTGDGSRVRDALALLAAGRARRLLITGVNPTTTGREIAATNPRFRYLFKCCVDLGYEALNTTGNALEAREWARREGFRDSLIVVTSTYHMPRALAEMAAAMPHMRIIAYPVDAAELHGPPWWANLRALRLLGHEYVKYLVVVARTALEHGREATAPSVTPDAKVG